MSKCSLRALNKRLADIRDPERGFVWGGDVVVDNGGEADANIILRHADLLWYFDDLDLNIDLDELLGQRIDLDKTRVDSAVETAEFRDEADISLADGFVGVGADNAARDGTAETDAGPEVVD